MRWMTIGSGTALAATAWLVAATASAAPQGGGAGNKGDTGGKGGLGPQSSTAAGAGGTQEQTVAPDTSLAGLGVASTPSNPDTTAKPKVIEKPWEVSATWETHRLLEQQYVADSSSKTFNVLFVTGRYSLTDVDILSLSGGAQQVFLSDPGEPGIRATDISLSYTRVVPLPQKFRLSATGTITAPVGFASQLSSNITSPGLSVGVSRRFGDLSVMAGLRGTLFWDRYTTANAIGAGTGSTSSASSDQGAGQPNTQWSAGGYISAEYDMPFYRPLSAGIALSDGYWRSYNVGSPPYGSPSSGATTNPQTDNQPWMQSYGGEVFVRYVVPDLSGFKSDLLIALANGDPSLGYPSVLHDGIVHPYLFFYNSAEVYLAYEGRY